VTRLGQPAFSLSVRDITKRSAAPQGPAVVHQDLDRHAAILRQLAQMGSELLAPLQDIASRADLIRQEALGPLGIPLYQTYATDIQQNSLAMLKLVERLLGMTTLNLPQD
jgi:signal transduction histidine kinase